LEIQKMEKMTEKNNVTRLWKRRDGGGGGERQWKKSETKNNTTSSVCRHQQGLFTLENIYFTQD